MIRRADTARAAADWIGAAASYQEALRLRPDLVHIHIQLGHALKETGDTAGAEGAYRDAVALDPSSRDGNLHLAHALKIAGDVDAAADLYVELAVADPEDAEAMREARDLLGRVAVPRRRALAHLLASSLPPAEAHQAGSWPASETCEVVFDASDLLSYFSRARRPSGIQRVQIETVRHAMCRPVGTAPAIGICCFIDGRDEWIAVPPAPLLHLIDLSVAADEADERVWRVASDRLLLNLMVAEPMRFRTGATIVNLGTSWWLQNYFLRIRDAQHRYGIVYVPMVYDLIPILFPEYCIETLIQDFIAWLDSVFFHTHSFLVISEATKRDLIMVAARRGVTVNADDVSVIPLDADFSRPARTTGGNAVDPRLSDRYILFVATIEPRKGHLTAFRAYQRVFAAVGPTTPRLMCVGRNGWHNDAVFAWLAEHPDIAERVTIVADVPDAALCELYERCLFVIAPSLYEGWGLPVTEALVHGKAVITTTSSSLPEAGGKFAIYVPPGDAAALAHEIERLIVSRDDREATEALIAAGFRARSWSTLATQVADEAIRLTSRARDRSGRDQCSAPMAETGRFYWLGRSFATELRTEIAPGEGFRGDLGWLSPEGWGCRVREGGGTVAFFPAEAVAGRLRVTLRLVGSERASCSFQLRSGATRIEGRLARREWLSVTIEATPDADGIVRIVVTGSTADAEAGLAPHPDQERAAMPSRAPPTTIGVAGFIIAPSPSSCA